MSILSPRAVGTPAARPSHRFRVAPLLDKSPIRRALRRAPRAVQNNTVVVLPVIIGLRNISLKLSLGLVVLNARPLDATRRDIPDWFLAFGRSVGVLIVQRSAELILSLDIAIWLLDVGYLGLGDIVPDVVLSCWLCFSFTIFR